MIRGNPSEPGSVRSSRGRLPWKWPSSALRGTTGALGFPLVVGLLATSSCRTPGKLHTVLPFGPPAVEISESYERDPHAPRFDHSVFDRLLEEHVDEDGWVDYRGFARNAEALDAYLDAVAGARFDELGRDQKLALLINAYNAATIQLILDHFPVASIRDIPRARRWKAERWVVGGDRLSLDEIEHREIRPHFAEPRIHFALVCAAVGCPPLRNEAFTGERLERQLQEQTRYVHAHSTWARWDPATRTLRLTPIYKWYEGDFEQTAGSVPAFATRYIPSIEPFENVRIRWLDYDWTLNDVDNRRQR